MVPDCERGYYLITDSIIANSGTNYKGGTDDLLHSGSEKVKLEGEPKRCT